MDTTRDYVNLISELSEYLCFRDGAVDHLAIEECGDLLSKLKRAPIGSATKFPGEGLTIDTLLNNRSAHHESPTV